MQAPLSMHVHVQAPLFSMLENKTFFNGPMEFQVFSHMVTVNVFIYVAVNFQVLLKWAAAWQNQQNECAPSEDQISLGIRPVWSGSSLSAWRKLGTLSTHWAHSEDSDQTGQMPRLIWVFAGRTLILLVFSCRGSNSEFELNKCFQVSNLSR